MVSSDKPEPDLKAIDRRVPRVGNDMPPCPASYDQDENVKAMRETAEKVGLTKLLQDIATSPAAMAYADIMRLSRALALLGDENYS